MVGSPAAGIGESVAGTTPLYGRARAGSSRRSSVSETDESAALLGTNLDLGIVSTPSQYQALTVPAAQRNLLVALPEYLNQKVHEEHLRGLVWSRDWQEVLRWTLFGAAGIACSGPNWVPNWELAGGGAKGVLLVSCAAVSYGAFYALSFEALRQVIITKAEKGRAQNGDEAQGTSSGVRYVSGLVAWAMIVSSASAFQSFKLNHGAIAYLSASIDFLTSVLTNSFSTHKLLKAPTTRIVAKIISGIVKNPKDFWNIVVNGRQSSREINRFLLQCSLSEDEMFRLQNQDGVVTAERIGDVIFTQGSTLRNKLKDNCFGMYNDLIWMPILLAIILASFSGYYYWLAGCEVFTQILAFFGAVLYPLVVILATLISFFPAYLEFTLVSEDLSSIFAFIANPSSIPTAIKGFIHQNSTEMKEGELVFRYSKVLWLTFRILLVATFFAWGHRAQAISKMDELSPVWKEIVKIMNIINNMCYKSRAMWKLTDTVGIAVVQRFGDAALELTAKCIASIRQLTGVVQDLSIAEITKFIAEWENKFRELELNMNVVINGAVSEIVPAGVAAEPAVEAVSTSTSRIKCW